MRENKVVELKNSILDELENLKMVRTEIQNYPFPKSKPSIVDLRYFASVLHDFYQGVERIFEKIARNVDTKIPKGEFWHSQLLRQMAKDFGEMRPAVVSKELVIRLEDYLKFRHLFRNVYGLHLQWDRLQPLIESFESVFKEFSGSIKEFLNFLDTIIEATQKGK